jgi:ribonuclease HI
LLAALRVAVQLKCEELAVYADSELVVKQIKGEYKVMNEGIRPLYESAQHMIRRVPNFSIQHIRREQNREADKLANLAMDRKSNVVEWE